MNTDYTKRPAPRVDVRHITGYEKHVITRKGERCYVNHNRQTVEVVEAAPGQWTDVRCLAVERQALRLAVYGASA